MCHYLMCQIYNKIKDESNFFYYFLLIRESLTRNQYVAIPFQISGWKESISAGGRFRENSRSVEILIPTQLAQI